MQRIGFVGTGALSAAIVRGLERAAAGRRPILVSPRGQAVSTALAAEFPAVTRAASNQEVVDGSDLVFLAVRPAQLAEVAEGLRFRPGQTVVSLAAGVPLSDLTAWVAPAGNVCRVMPMPPIQYGEGPILLHPDLPDVHEILAPLGQVVVAASEEELATLTLGSTVMSSFYGVQETVLGWLTGKGIARETALPFVSAMFKGFSRLAAEDVAAGRAAVPAEHETEGGLNQRVRRYLHGQDWFSELGRALDDVATHKLT